MGRDGKLDAGQYDPLSGALAKLVVFLTMVVLVAGSLVTGYKAALSDPTWPQFVGHWYPVYWVGGLFYEDGHRITVAILGLATLALVIRTWMTDRRRGMAWLAGGTFFLLVAQGLVGGVIIKLLRPVAASMLHASAAQLFFCFAVTYALVTSRGWFSSLQPTIDQTTAASGNPETYSRMQTLRRLTAVLVVLTFVQIILGSGVRHGDRVHDTMFWTFLSAHILTWTGIVVAVGALNSRIRELGALAAPLRFTSTWAAGLVMFQFLLGFFSYFGNRARLEANTPHPEHVAVTSTHLLIGGIILATFLVTAIRARRLYLPIPLNIVAEPGVPASSPERATEVLSS